MHPTSHLDHASTIHVSEEVQAHQHLFEESPFYQLMSAGTEESILEALELVTKKKVDVNLISYKPTTNGWNYLHYMIEMYVGKVGFNKKIVL